MYYAYVLESQVDKTYYIGQTNNIESRINKHNFGKSKSYTKAKRPWRLIYKEQFNTRSEAIKRENYLKKIKNKKYLEKLIKKGP